TFALHIFQEQFAVVAARQRLVDQSGGAALVQAALAEEQAVSGGEMIDGFAHGDLLRMGGRQTTSTILPKWAVAFMCASAAAASARGKVRSMGSDSLPASTAGHRSARADLTMARTSSGVRVRKVTPI